MNIDEKLDLFTLDRLDEIFQKVIRKGKVKGKLFCPVGAMKAVDGKCVLMKPAERKNRTKAAIKRGKKFKANVSVQKKALRKRLKSMKKRGMILPDQVGEE